ncbi:APC family permease [Desulfosarcina ovata]|uniref:Amino acid permease n=1 Tax=Desulfosarcina ovata subsp. ovata TaxID=2752305 RepID=A0A5K8A9Z7_9BACT|nr:amino acid permease [Desulfosarcina ovata]BBO89523.1 amino acid permease [Desulfosarcina ovata subsp. ovata]
MSNGLKRELGLFSATALVVANMVGTGIFTTSGFIMAELGDPRALILCWICGGLFALCGALCYGELGARFPRAGGEYVFLKECLGRPVGFLSGWISLIVGFSAPIAAASMAFATYFFQTFAIPSGNEGFVFSMSGIPLVTLSPLTLTAIGVIVLFSLIHYHSLHVGSRVQNGLTLFKIILVVVFIGAGLFMGNGSADHFAVTATTAWSSEKFAVALIFVSFAYSGWNAAAYLGDEIVDPQKNIPISLFAGTVIVMILYVLLNVVYLYALSPEAMQGIMEIGAKSAKSLFGRGISRLFSGAVALGLLSVLSAMILTGPRIYYAMSRDRLFFQIFGRLDANRNTPAKSIFLQAAIAIMMVVSASFDSLLLYIGLTLSLFAMLAVIGLMRVRRQSPLSGGSYRTFGYPFTPLLFILGNLWIIFFSIKSRPITALFSLGTIGLGIAAYLYFTCRYHPEDESAVVGGTANTESQPLL